MTYLNENEREKLLNDLVKMNFNQARRKLRRMDPDAELEFFRNSQRVNEWMTRYKLASLGTIVTLIESREDFEEDPSHLVRLDYDLSGVVVAPTPDNRT
jgi:hypothetical protein